MRKKEKFWEKEEERKKMAKEREEPKGREKRNDL